MAKVTIHIKDGTPEQSKIIANMICIMFDGNNAQLLLESFPFYESIKEEKELELIDGDLKLSEEDNPEHEVYLSFTK